MVDANSAPVAVLMALPKLGPVRASAIVEARRDGPFASLFDLERRVWGIGPATTAAMEPYVRFAPTDNRPNSPAP